MLVTIFDRRTRKVAINVFTKARMENWDMDADRLEELRRETPNLLYVIQGGRANV